MNNLYHYFEKIYEKGKLSHAFLIGNVSLSEIKPVLLKIFNDFILKSKNNVDSNPNIYFLEEKNGIIKKDDIRNLLKNLTTTSQFDGSKIYVIDKCENLNDFSYNALLKTLEEPAENIYAFLLTTNIDAVKTTIASRCQKIFISSYIDIKYEDSCIDIANSLIESIEKIGVDSITSSSKIYKLIEDRDSLVNILKYMLNKYMEALNVIVNSDSISNYLLENNDINSLISKILVINDSINRIEFNLNKNMCIDRLIIEMGRCNI